MRTSSDRTTRAVIAAIAVAVFWAGFAYDVSRPADAKRYQRMLLQVAESAHDATRTAALVGQLELDGRVTGPFATSSFDDATKGLSGAEKKLAGEAPPDDESAARREELVPLLSTAVIALGDTAGADDDSDVRGGVNRLNDVAQRLDDFAEALR